MDDWLADHPISSHAFLLTPAAKAEIRERLDQANITERVLMPGLDGLAAWLRRYYGPLGGSTDQQDEGGAMADPPRWKPAEGDRMTASRASPAATAATR